MIELYVLMPEEPTEEMIQAVIGSHTPDADHVRGIYADFIVNRPKEVPEEVVERLSQIMVDVAYAHAEGSLHRAQLRAVIAELVGGEDG